MRNSPSSNLHWRQGWLWFTVLSVLGMLFVFRGALWGERLLVPLDVAPNLFPKFRWMDPQATGVPANHYLVDFFDFELPRQYLFYHGLRGGEFPWWEPYSDGGHPLVAEAHNSLTDPFRLLLYRCLPFEMAYNWIRVVHSFLLGLGMFVLLGHLGCSRFARLFGALSFQFASSHAFFFFPPSVAASFLYYPFLWVVWSSSMEAPSWRKVGLGALLCAGIFAAGNQQSAAYLPLFMGCFCVAYGGRSRERWARALRVGVGSALVGALVAAPVLLPQIEIHLRSKRDLMQGFQWLSLASGVFSLSGFFPWVLGTFRTLDLSKLVDQGGVGFAIYIGTAGALLAVVGLGGGSRERWQKQPEFRMAVLLIGCYLVLICSTPLVKLLYIRASDLAVMGLVVVCARGLDSLVSEPRAPWVHRSIAWGNILLAVGMLLLNLFAFFAYPRLLPRLRQLVREREAAVTTFDQASQLRRFQVENLPNEISVRNPETVLAFAGALSLLGLVRVSNRRWAQGTVLVLNLCPLLLFAARFIPSASMADWHRLLEGGPEQARLRALAAPGFKRLTEQAPGRFEYLFPGEIALLYRVHTWVGYYAFFLKSPAEIEALPPANFSYRSPERGMQAGVLDPALAEADVRFVWQQPNPRRVSIARETCNAVTLRLDAGPAGNLVRTDSYYPGWTSTTPGVRPVPGQEQTYAIPGELTEVEFRYRPTHLTASLVASGAALAGIGLVWLFPRRRPDPGPLGHLPT